ncbi:MAG TPA: carbohydrate binding family 9 domain-containing protein [Acidobacteriaceae bacterium]|nr:carbohydrate binding family 9 domain-containing protein [Acidobacteriaceae bacterium]
MLRVSKFIDRNPQDGQAVSESTTAFLGYTHEYLFVAFICRDRHPRLLRAHLLQRDALSDDDYVEVMLDTFHDERRAFLFKTNALGVQADALYTEQTGSDYSFDTVWDTWGKRYAHGYVVLMRIPFASLRFKDVPEGDLRTWGILLQRAITRKNESAWWPQVQHDVAGRLTQEIAVDGFADVERGRNRQLEPYGLLHSIRQLNTVNPFDPYFNDKHLQGYSGMDAKMVLHNSLVLDLTFNPDFSQIGIENPAPPNQRFKYYYPELRPFFIENSSYFSTPLNLYYTPNIVMPQFGERLSGKMGPWAVGLLNIDDRNPGEQTPQGSPDYGTRAHFYVGRVNRDIGPQSDVGVIYAERDYLGSYNRDGGADYRVRFDQRWTLTGQAVTSETEHLDRSWQSGQAYFQGISYSDLHKSFYLYYDDIAAGYLTETGFFTRPDIREPNGAVSYTFRPKNGPLLSHGPSLYSERIWDHTGLPLDFYFDPSYSFSFKYRTSLSTFLQLGQDRLRPSDYPALPNDVEYHSHLAGANFYTSPIPQIAIGATAYAGSVINYYPRAGDGPSPVNVDSAHTNLEVKPLQQIDLLNTYEFDRFTDPASGDVAYDSHQLVTRWNLQMNKAWSLTFIGEYLATLPNEDFTSLTNNKDIFGDVLLTYLPHPGTAFYVGYTTDYQNLNSDLCTRGVDGLCEQAFPILPRTGSSFLNDEQTLYMKLNYLLRF